MTKHGAIEYDIPQCDPETHPGCVHTLSTRQRIGGNGGSLFGIGSHAAAAEDDTEVDIVFAVGHQHRGGMGINMYDDDTENLICSSVPTYGRSNQVGDELGYVVAMSTCTFDPPLRMKRNSIVRIAAMYNNTMPHTGVMSLFYIALAEVPASGNTASSFSNVSNGSAFSPVVALMFLTVIGAAVFMKWESRRGYRPLERDMTRTYT